VWQRPQQILSRLAKHHPVLFIEEPEWKDAALSLEVSDPHPNITRVVPVMRREEHASVEAQCEAIIAPLHRMLKQHAAFAGRFHMPVQWFYSPMTAPSLLDQFGAGPVVYDCMDELANFRYAPPDIGEREKLLLDRADVVFTGGYKLYESKSRHHGNAHFYGCGVDFTHYAMARQPETRIPPELATLPRPVLGYFGVIDERIDYDLLQHLAHAMPEASIVMVGPVVKVDEAALPRAPNIHWLGQRAYADLPALVKSFDVCLMPFALNEATQYINPTKTLEYMAAGKPVVSTAVPDVVRNFTPIVDVAHSNAEFETAVKRALDSGRQDFIAAGIDRARKASWGSIVGEMRAHMLKCMRAYRVASAGVQSATTLARSAGALR
jgi:glycosyltransferase involved in cell wall biosynthesis